MDDLDNRGKAAALAATPAKEPGVSKESFFKRMALLAQSPPPERLIIEADPIGGYPPEELNWSKVMEVDPSANEADAWASESRVDLQDLIRGGPKRNRSVSPNVTHKSSRSDPEGDGPSSRPVASSTPQRECDSPSPTGSPFIPAGQRSSSSPPPEGRHLFSAEVRDSTSPPPGGSPRTPASQRDYGSPSPERELSPPYTQHTPSKTGEDSGPRPLQTDAPRGVEDPPPSTEGEQAGPHKEPQTVTLDGEDLPKPLRDLPTHLQAAEITGEGGEFIIRGVAPPEPRTWYELPASAMITGEWLTFRSGADTRGILKSYLNVRGVGSRMEFSPTEEATNLATLQELISLSEKVKPPKDADRQEREVGIRALLRRNEHLADFLSWKPDKDSEAFEIKEVAPLVKDVASSASPGRKPSVKQCLQLTGTGDVQDILATLNHPVDQALLKEGGMLGGSFHEVKSDTWNRLEELRKRAETQFVGGELLNLLHKLLKWPNAPNVARANLDMSSYVANMEFVLRQFLPFYNAPYEKDLKAFVDYRREVREKLVKGMEPAGLAHTLSHGPTFAQKGRIFESASYEEVNSELKSGRVSNFKEAKPRSRPRSEHVRQNDTAKARSKSAHASTSGKSNKPQFAVTRQNQSNWFVKHDIQPQTLQAVMQPAQIGTSGQAYVPTNAVQPPRAVQQQVLVPVAQPQQFQRPFRPQTTSQFKLVNAGAGTSQAAARAGGSSRPTSQASKKPTFKKPFTKSKQ